MKLSMLFAMVVVAAAVPEARAQYAIGYSGVTTDGVHHYAWSEFDASGLPASVQVCHQNGYVIPAPRIIPRRPRALHSGAHPA
jgi:hypothetical protein